MRRRFLPAVLPIGLLFALIGCYSGGRPPRIGANAPDFTVQDSDHKVTLSQFRGRVVVLNFWATWCPPCVAEIGELNALQRDISGRGGTVLGISVDQDPSAYEKFLQEAQVTFPTFDDTSGKTPGIYGTSMYPETYVINRDGDIARKIVGPQNFQDPAVIETIEAVLKQN